MADRAFISGTIKKERRLFELIKHEDHCAEQQDEELHRHFENRVEKEAEPARTKRIAGKVALNLGLIGPKIGKGEKESADETGPESVALMRIGRKIDRLKLAQFSGGEQRVIEGNLRGQLVNDHSERDGHSGEDDQHLVTLGQTNDCRAAGDDVKDNESAGEPDGQVELPAEDGGKNDGRRINRDAGGNAALNKKKKCPEKLRLSIEPLAEILVGGVNV